MSIKTKIFLNASTKLPIITSQNFFTCLARTEQCSYLQKNKLFLIVFNECYGCFIEGIVKESICFDNAKGYFTKGYYFNAEAYAHMSPNVTKKATYYLTVEGGHLFLFLYRDKFRLNIKKFNQYLAQLSNIILEQLNSDTQLISQIKNDLQLFTNFDTKSEFVLLIIKNSFDMFLNKGLFLNRVGYLSKWVKDPVGCTQPMRAWFFDIMTRYFFTLVVLIGKAKKEMVLQHNYKQLWEYLFHLVNDVKIYRVTAIYIYEGEVKSRPLLSHGMSLPADLVVPNDGNTHLNSAELDLINKFL